MKCEIFKLTINETKSKDTENEENFSAKFEYKTFFDKLLVFI